MAEGLKDQFEILAKKVLPKTGRTEKEIGELRKQIEEVDRISMLQGNTDVWLYILNSLGKINQDEVERVAEAFQKFKKENKKVALSSIFKEVDIRLPKDPFFDYVCFDYNLPPTREELEQGVKKLRESPSFKFQKRYGLPEEVEPNYDPMQELKRMFIKDVDSLTNPFSPLAEEKIKESHGKQRKTFIITKTGRHIATLVKDDFNRLQPLLQNDGLILTRGFGLSPILTTKNS